MAVVSTRLARITRVVATCWFLILANWLSAPGVAISSAFLTLLVTPALLIVGAIAEIKANPQLGRRSRIALAGGIALASLALFGIFLSDQLSDQSVPNPFFRLRFALSESALDNYATDRSLPAVATKQTVGLFRFARIERTPTETVFITGMCGVIDQCGLVYSLSPPLSAGRVHLTRLGDHWYHLYNEF
jgi:multisubunit Na+/H+ antiporter MnhB subunit